MRVQRRVRVSVVCVDVGVAVDDVVVRRRSVWLGGRRLGVVVGLDERHERVTRLRMSERDGCWVYGGMREAESSSVRRAASWSCIENVTRHQQTAAN